MISHTLDRTGRSAIAVLVCLTVCWILAGTVRAQESSMLDYADQKLLDIGAQLQNAKMRLSKDFAGAGAIDDGQPTPLVIECCRQNLETIDGKLKEIRAVMVEMLAYYREQHSATGVGLLAEMNLRLDAITTGMNYFARAPSKAVAFDARRGLIRPWNEFRNGIVALRNCCPIPPEIVPKGVAEESARADENQTDKKAKKQGKKGKKKQDSEEP